MLTVTDSVRLAAAPAEVAAVLFRQGTWDALGPPWFGLSASVDSAVWPDPPGTIQLHWKDSLGGRDLVLEKTAASRSEWAYEMSEGPFASLRVRFRLDGSEKEGTTLSETVRLQPSFGLAGEWLLGEEYRRKIAGILRWRMNALARMIPLRTGSGGRRRLRVLMAGGTGFLGARLTALLRALGHEVVVLTRGGQRGPFFRHWDPARGVIEVDREDVFDAIINLAGEPVAQRWTANTKRKILESRVDSTLLLVDLVRGMRTPPRVFLSGSAIGYYGFSGGGGSTEDDTRGAGFLADVCGRWEDAAGIVSHRVERTVLLRTGVVLDPRGGALNRLLPIFSMGLGGPVGNGRQPFPWIALEDWLYAVEYLLFASKIRGPVNLVAPALSSNRAFARTLGKVLRRPAVLPAPAPAMRLAFGQMAREMLLGGVPVIPEVLQNSGFQFGYPELESALRAMLVPPRD